MKNNSRHGATKLYNTEGQGSSPNFRKSLESIVFRVMAREEKGRGSGKCAYQIFLLFYGTNAG